MSILRRCMLVIIITLTLFTTNAFASNRCVSMIDQHAYTFMLNLADCNLHPTDLYDVEAYLKAHPTITALNLEDNTQLFDGANSQILSQDTHLKYLSVKNTMTAANGDIVTSDLAKIPNLTILDLSHNNLTDASIDSLMKAHSLRALNLTQNPRITFNGLRILAGHPSITNLNLTRIPLDNTSLKALSQDTHLTHITLGDGSNCQRISYSDDSLMGFAKNPNLVDFSLSCSNVSLPFLLTLTQSNSLRSLALPYDDLNVYSIKIISLNKHLTSLDLSGNPWIGTYSGSDYESKIASIHTLTRLNLSGVRNVNIDPLAKLKQLIELDLDGDNIVGSWLSFKNNTSLKVVSMKLALLANDWVREYQYLAQLKSLTSLDVSLNDGITDETVIEFTNNPSITTLTLDHDLLGVSAAHALAADPHLYSLSLGGAEMPVKALGILLKNPALKILNYAGRHNPDYDNDGLALSTAKYLRTVNISYHTFNEAIERAILANTHLVTIINHDNYASQAT